MHRGSLHARVVAALVIPLVAFAAVLGALALLHPRAIAPGGDIRLEQIGGVYLLATGRGPAYRLRLPRGWGVARVPAARWVEVAQQRSCEAAALSALLLTRGPRPQTLAERASTLLWQMLGRAAEPGATVTGPVGLAAERAVVAADMRARVAVLALAPDGAARGASPVAVIVEGVAGRAPGCDHRRVRLTPEHLGNLVAAVETHPAARPPAPVP
jgi:hypothetical protein